MRLNGLDDVVDYHEYPINSADSVQRHGDEVVGLQSDQETAA